MATLTLRVKGKPGAISFNTFLSVMNNSFDILRDLDSAISSQPNGSLDWVVTKMSMNSAAVEISSKAKESQKIDFGDKVASGYLSGMKTLTSEGITPPYFSYNCLKYLKAIARDLGKNGAEAIEYGDPVKNEFIEVNKEMKETTTKLMGYKYQAHGAIEGTLEMISIHRPARFNIYHNLFLRAVRCDLPESKTKEVAHNLGRRVIAYGLVSYNAKDEPISVKLERLEIIPREDDLPTIDQFVGSDPDFTGDMTTEEFIRSIRNG